MKYLIVQEWENTKGNHAGMKHMCDLLGKKYPDKYRVITRCFLPRQKTGKTRVANFIYYRFFLVQRYFKYNRIFEWQFNKMLNKLKADDEVFLMEYMHPHVDQYSMAKRIRATCQGVMIYGMAHLTPSNLQKVFCDDSLFKIWATPIDKILTLGSSLTPFFESVGIPSDKISVGFHYVDRSYYNIEYRMHNLRRRPVIIMMGNLQRNYTLLSEIIRRVEDVDWIVCGGLRYSEIADVLPNSDNIQIKGFVSEDDLRELMKSSDISLNVMDDTVGSNVVTTSMAMALAMVVSDVGSIRDYCDETNAVFCNNDAESFVKGIKSIICNKERMESMQLSSLDKSKSLSIQKVHCWFDSLR